MNDKLFRALLAQLEAEMFGGPVQEQRMTALRVSGTSFEVVQLDDNGMVIEPVRCTCHWSVVADANCPLHKGGFT